MANPSNLSFSRVSTLSSTQQSYPALEAQEARTAIHDYFDNRLAEAQLRERINSLSAEALKQTSSNGSTLLNYAFRSIFETKIAHVAQKCLIVMSLLCARARLVNGDAIAFLLLQADSEGSTPLHWILRSGDNDSLTVYLNELHMAIHNGWIHAYEYRRLILQDTQAGFTPLHQALKSGNIEKIKIYFQELQWAMEKRWITDNDYHLLLVQANQAGFTPLHQVAVHGKLDLVLFLLNILDERLMPKEYLKALTQQNKAHYIPSCSKGGREADEINQILRNKTAELQRIIQEQEGHHETGRQEDRNDASNHRDNEERDDRAFQVTRRDISTHNNRNLEENRPQQVVGDGREDYYRRETNGTGYTFQHPSQFAPTRETRSYHAAASSNHDNDYRYGMNHHNNGNYASQEHFQTIQSAHTVEAVGANGYRFEGRNNGNAIGSSSDFASSSSSAQPAVAREDYYRRERDRDDGGRFFHRYGGSESHARSVDRREIGEVQSQGNQRHVVFTQQGHDRERDRLPLNRMVYASQPPVDNAQRVNREIIYLVPIPPSHEGGHFHPQMAESQQQPRMDGQVLAQRYWRVY